MAENTSRKPITKPDLAKARGHNQGDPLYIAVKDPFGDEFTVFDVSSAKGFYGPESGYHLFTGRHATYGWATTCLDPEKQDGDYSNLSSSQKDTQQQWYEKYSSKYPVDGVLVSDDYRI